jgi:hypothetical protein
MSDDIGCVITAHNFKVAMIRGYPAIHDFFDFDFMGGHDDTTGCFLSPVAGITFYLEVHELPHSLLDFRQFAENTSIYFDIYFL